MSKLDKLIQKYCPNGVKYVNLGNLCTVVTKQTGFDYTNHIKSKLLLEPDGNSVPYIQTKFFTGKQFNYKTDYYVPIDIVNKFPKITLDEKCLLFSIVGASIGNVGLFPGEKKCFLGGAICVAKIKSEYNVEYLYYCIESYHVQHQIRRKIKGAGQATVTVEDIRQFTIPLPPLPVQEEIVRILDSFTALTTELQAELQARKKQFKYYVDAIVDQKIRLKICDGKQYPEWRYLSTEEISQDKKGAIKIGPFGSALKKDDFLKEGIRVYEQENVFNEDFYSCRYFISKEKYDILKSCTLEANDIVISMMGTVGQCAIFPQDAPLGIMNSHLLRIQLKEGIEPEYIRFMIKYNHNIRSQIERNSVGSIMTGLSASIVKRLVFPIPSIEEQRHIVNVLNRFDSLCNDISNGLPAEIEARQKQYEYYRDKLLTFKPLS